MLDENLPTFVLKPSKDKPKQLSTFLFSQHGAEYEPSYTVRHLDPDQHASRNRYAAALYDAFSPEVLYAEVLLIPEWTQPPPLSEQARLNGAIPPPPEPILPSEFVIQLYNPDQQIVVRHKTASFNRSASWEFEMPQQTFRAPSGSALDRTQYDPAASEITPKIVFKWKKDSKFSKDLACFMSGKSTDIEGKGKHRDPDITVSIFKALKELTLYEPNLQRVDIEDLKGFEVVLLLGAVVIRDVYFGSLKEAFNLSVSKKSNPASPTAGSAILQSDARPQSVSPTHDPRIPSTDPRTQWEIEAESARLRRQALEEERQRRRREEEEERLTRQLLEREEKEHRRKKHAEIQQETQWLQQMYGREDASARPDLPPRDQRHHSEAGQSAYLQTQQGQYPVAPYVNGWGGYPPGPYMSGAASQSSFLTPVPAQQPQIKPKSSIFNFRRRSDQDANKLQRKRSAVF
ncbi:uncharacterized protein Z520_10037 [Fonsecaea multimorphosa CBS 102226]|uniref:Uncharacterized protein n=1 Tax=Fonsecaea multimorphosa CBS 102226 TaxID=1442371 RepID=A0A0D2JLX8_9EURO|nr:uncharacterized protein Z520_10037 [Fonsecaea multimorphosa CBS 102226]KIX94327.1 hypothetical protein Z520_10037 [Fonsecaea multimorphosa CBS 102226]OAL19661.1 hypothetical protein AYO22_09533 [Fonsecaea multimorphosa]